MPTISEFYGILIRIFFDDHNPPHFHAEYQGFMAKFNIQDASLMEGQFPTRAKGLVVEWAKTRQKELLEDWELAKAHAQLKKIDPLE